MGRGYFFAWAFKNFIPLTVGMIGGVLITQEWFGLTEYNFVSNFVTFLVGLVLFLITRFLLRGLKEFLEGLRG